MNDAIIYVYLRHTACGLLAAAAARPLFPTFILYSGEIVLLVGHTSGNCGGHFCCCVTFVFQHFDCFTNVVCFLSGARTNCLFAAL